MNDATFFTHPKLDWQRRYEALRASFVDRLPDKVVADRFGYKSGYVRLLKHQFRHGKIDLSEVVPEGKAYRRRVNAETRKKIGSWREHRLSAGEIAQLLSEDGVEISVSTVERVLAEEGFPKLPRRTRVKIGLTVKGAGIPSRSRTVELSDLNGARFECAGSGVFLFAPFLAQLDIDKVVRSAGLPGSSTIPATSYLLSFLALKLLGNERYAHVGDHAFDPGLGLFAGLNVLPKCTAMSTYSYSLDEVHLLRLQQAFVEQASRLGLYDGNIVNLDFHTAPHFGDESVLEKHWAGARGKRMKGALCLFAQDAQSKLMLFTASDIRRDEASDQVLSFLSFWEKVRRGVKPTLVFDSQFTTYGKLSKLNAQGVFFITLRRRGRKQLDQVVGLTGWNRIHIPHAKRKFPNPQVHESIISLRGYRGGIRQIIVRGNGHEKPAFLISNDFDSPVELLVGNYARRWRVENGIAEAVKFFHLNALSSPILVKIHFDIVMTMIADTLYTMLAQKVRGFEDCDAPKLYRHFVRGKGLVEVRDGTVTVTYPRRAHNPVLRGVQWTNLPQQLPGLAGAPLILRFA
ncbi:MAG: transposase [Deltaproteobacteria bacterium]|nr:transposase [Deltaproteobacteria bacterium]